MSRAEKIFFLNKLEGSALQTSRGSGVPETNFESKKFLLNLKQKKSYSEVDCSGNISITFSMLQSRYRQTFSSVDVFTCSFFLNFATILDDIPALVKSESFFFLFISV